MNLRVLVLDGEQRAALAVVRSLGRRGVKVHVGATTTPCLGGQSRQAAGTHRLPDPLAAPTPFREQVLQLVEAARIDLVLPITEASWLAVLEDTGTDQPLPLPGGDLSRFLLGTDKEAVLAIANRLGIHVPDERVIQPAPGVEDSIPLEWFPVVIKPARSIAGPRGGRRSGGVAYPRSREELRDLLSRLASTPGPFLVQRRIEGSGLGVFALRWRGRILATFAHRRLREKPPSGGVSVCSVSVEVPRSLLDQSVALLEALEWEGVAMVEFKREATTGRAFLMEVNPRFWGSLQLAIDAGVDFPWLLTSAALGLPVVPVTSWKHGMRLRWFLGGVDHLITRATHRKRDLFLPPGTPSLLATAASSLAPWWPRQRGEVLRFDDPWPGLHEWRTWLSSLRRSHGR